MASFYVLVPEQAGKLQVWQSLQDKEEGAASVVPESSCPAARPWKRMRSRSCPAVAGRTDPAEQDGRAEGGRSRTDAFLQGLRKGGPASSPRAPGEPPSMNHAGGDAGLRR